jgi:hypothetical protein
VKKKNKKARSEGRLVTFAEVLEQSEGMVATPAEVLEDLQKLLSAIGSLDPDSDLQVDYLTSIGLTVAHA